ncbi:hypothetical protein [Paenibacillus sp. 1011MAR3C5]|uniref:hypothetical protein n=1 Tax=Paenibacillus sp. 1011MAR3C5 TaxID=1675787 RepID=UPI0011C4089F|nr:hypothetical protein [Paenibacillus sp. 1011MAR3C5]
MELRSTIHTEADEVRVFELFGGDLPVYSKPTVSRNAKRSGDRLYKRAAGCCKFCSHMSAMPPVGLARAGELHVFSRGYSGRSGNEGTALTVTSL